MIISEKQIMKLIALANAYSSELITNREYDLVHEIQKLLSEIHKQQSEELKEIG